MLLIKDISLTQFKTYREAAFSFSERIIGICGQNGIGKTNLLDALYYLCFTRSYFSKSDQQNVQYGSSGFRIEGNMEAEGTIRKVVCILRETGKKEVLLDDEAYEKFSQHIGKFPCVIITPDDVQIITEGSEQRRRFMDTLLCQLDPRYLQQLIEYNRILQQRNSFLKSLAERRAVNQALLDVYDSQLIRPGNYLFEQRTSYLHRLIALVVQLYREIAGTEENIALAYWSQLQQTPLQELLKLNRDKDILLGRTSSGVHKDDLDIQLQQQPFKTSASQGQRKSMLFALKLGEFELLKQEKGFSPILLLDDVFEKLDENRMFNLLDRVCLQNDGQLFLTDTHAARISRHFDRLAVRYQLIELP